MLKRIVQTLYGILETVTGVLFLCLFALNILRIVSRYLMGISWIWVPDVSRLLFVWVVFLGASVLVGRNEHLVMDFFSAKLKPAAARRLHVAIQLGQMTFFAVMLAGGILIAGVRMRIPFDTLDFPTGWAYIAVPVCAAFMILFSADNIFQSLQRTEKHE